MYCKNLCYFYCTVNQRTTCLQYRLNDDKFIIQNFISLLVSWCFQRLQCGQYVVCAYAQVGNGQLRCQQFHPQCPLTVVLFFYEGLPAQLPTTLPHTAAIIQSDNKNIWQAVCVKLLSIMVSQPTGDSSVPVFQYLYLRSS